MATIGNDYVLREFLNIPKYQQNLLNHSETIGKAKVSAACWAPQNATNPYKTIMMILNWGGGSKFPAPQISFGAELVQN